MIAINGLILIVTSIFIGTHILAFFGISLPVVQVGGGLIVISTGWSLLRQSDHDGADGKGASKECNETGLFPAGILSAYSAFDGGAGLDFGGDRGRRQPGGRLRVALAADCRYVARFFGDSRFYLLELSFRREYRRTLGDSAMNVIIRLSSFILVCIGVQILWNGVSALLRAFPK